MDASPPLLSIIISTRNQPTLLADTLHSVFAQRDCSFEVIVVIDGPAREHEQHYRTLVDTAPKLARMLVLVETSNGHGTSYSWNDGTAHAQGQYLCFLRDGDRWIDPDHLSRVAESITTASQPVQLFFWGDRALQDEMRVPEVTERKVSRKGVFGDLNAPAALSCELLNNLVDFPLRDMVVLKSFCLRIGGFDEGLRYNEHNDFTLRAVDNATSVRYNLHMKGRRSTSSWVANKAAHAIEPELSTRLFQLRVIDKAILFSKRPELRRYAMRLRALALKKVEDEFARRGQLET